MNNAILQIAGAPKSGGAEFPFSHVAQTGRSPGKHPSFSAELDRAANESKVECRGSRDEGQPSTRQHRTAGKQQRKTGLVENEDLAGACAVTAQPDCRTEPVANNSGEAAEQVASPVEMPAAVEGQITADAEPAVTASPNALLTEGGIATLPEGIELLETPEDAPDIFIPQQPSSAAPTTKAEAQLTKDASQTPTPVEKVATPPQVGDKPSEATVESDQSPVVREDNSAGVALANVLIRRAVRVARGVRNTAESREDQARGISSAQVSGAMNTTTKQDSVAGATKQILPGSPTIGSRLARSNETETPAAEALFAAGLLATAKSPEGRTEGLSVGDVSRFEPTRLERLGEIISREVRMFKRSADDMVDVVLTPDTKTQILLRLQWRDGQVEVMARCELGDHHTLNLHRGQLQSSLAQQGVKLSSLVERASTGFTEFFHPPGHGHSHNGGQHQPESKLPVEDERSRPAIPNPLLAGKPAPTRDRFETWA